MIRICLLIKVRIAIVVLLILSSYSFIAAQNIQNNELLLKIVNLKDNDVPLKKGSDTINKQNLEIKITSYNDCKDCDSSKRRRSKETASILAMMSQEFTSNPVKSNYEHILKLIDSILLDQKREDRNKKTFVKPKTLQFLSDLKDVCNAHLSTIKKSGSIDIIFADSTVVKFKCSKCDSIALVDTKEFFEIKNDTTVLQVKLMGETKKQVVAKLIIPRSKSIKSSSGLSISGLFSLILLGVLLYYVYQHHFSRISKDLKLYRKKYLEINHYMNRKNDSTISTIDKIKELINTLESKLNALEADKNNLVKKNNELETQVSSLNDQLAILKSENDRLVAALKENLTEIAPPVASPFLHEALIPGIQTSYFNLPNNNIFTKEVDLDDKNAFVIIEHEEGKNEGIYRLNDKKQVALLSAIPSLEMFCSIENKFEVRTPADLELVESGLVNKNASGQWQIKQKASVRFV